MKINWFSPLLPEKTDIAHYSARIVRQLCEHAELTLWTDQKRWDSAIERICPVRPTQQMKWADLNYDGAAVYHIGNNPDYHTEIWRISTLHPGIVVLHDYHLQHLFGGIFKSRGNSTSYYRVMQHYYGMRGIQAARDFWNGKVTTEYMSEHFPLAEYPLENAIGVIVHNNYSFEKIACKSRLPVALLPLPYPSTIDHETITQHMQNRLQTAQAGCRLIVFGYLGPNRRIESVLQALAQVRNRHGFLLDIYGQVWDVELLEKKIAELGLQQQVTIHGFVEEKELSEALNRAHLALNLRYPTMGEASGTQLRIWDHALPSLVTRVGWYAELPSDVVWFVRPEEEISDIVSALNTFIENSHRFMEMGEQGKNYLEQWHDPKDYAQSLATFVKDVCERRTMTTAFDLAERAAAEISIWTDGADDAQFTQQAAAIYDLFRRAS